MSIRILDFDDGFSSASNPAGGSFGDVFLAGSFIYLFGDATTDGSSRLYAISNEIKMEIRISGTWTLVENFPAP